ncbi:MAG: diguanylate cyclase [Gammaproteobacteria bacterium]|nr:MAG: diguanylate cyclase [Gammaproteobacteria bacterium]
MNSSSVERFTTSSNHALEIATAISANKPINRTIAALVLKLQTTLNLNQIIETFFESLKADMAICGIEYEYPLLYTHINRGIKTNSSYSYLIEVDDDTWGNIVIYCKDDLTQDEKCSLDEYVSATIFPLRNAIQYENAMVVTANESYLGLPNWGLLEGQITREAKLAFRQKQPLSLVLIDIDRFMILKKNHGLMLGDLIIRHVYETLQSVLRDTDLLYRFGYDQFSLILSNTQEHDANIIAERVRSAVSNHELLAKNNKGIRVTASIGITELDSSDSVDSLYARAYNALKLAKNSGRNQVKIADGKFLR